MKVNTIVRGYLKFIPSGNAFLISEDLDNDLFIYKGNIKNAFPNDIVDVRIKKGRNRNSVEGEVIDVVKPHSDKILCVYQGDNKAYYKGKDIDVYIFNYNSFTPEIGDTILVKYTINDGGLLIGDVVKVIGDFSTDSDAQMETILLDNSFEIDFSDEVMNETLLIDTSIDEEEIKLNREDFRDTVTVTIDPATAKDLDDAISIKFLDNDLVEVGIHIADVTHYVKEDSEIDKEAYKRGTSVYLVDRVIPMLPPLLSNMVCSLNPNEDKYTFSAIFTMNMDGEVLSDRYTKGVVNINKRLSYEDAQLIIEQNTITDDISKAVINLYNISSKLRTKRMQDSVEFAREEVKFKLDSDSKPIGIYTKVSKESNFLVEEFMLLANRYVASFLSKTKKVGVYRIHEEPEEEKITQLASTLANYNLYIDTRDTSNFKSDISKILKEVKNTPIENMVSLLIVRTMRKAVYSTSNLGHYGLGFTDYTHFTSPIRRYPDLKVHFLLDSYLKNPNKNFDYSKYSQMCEWTSKREYEASKAERESIIVKQIEYLSSKIGEVYEAVITSVKEFGIFCEIIENKCEGLISRTSLEMKDITIMDNNRIMLPNGKYKYLGDTIKICIDSVDINCMKINFTYS